MQRRPQFPKPTQQVWECLLRADPDLLRHGYDLARGTDLKSGILYPLRTHESLQEEEPFAGID